MYYCCISTKFCRNIVIFVIDINMPIDCRIFLFAPRWRY